MRKRVLIRIGLLFGILLSGILLSRAEIYNGVAPFGMAMLLAVCARKRAMVMLFAGLVIGVLTRQLGFDATLIRIVPYFIMSAVLLLLKIKRPNVFIRLVGVASIIIPAFFIPLSLYRFLLCLIEALAVFILTPLCHRAVELLKKNRLTVAKDETFTLVLVGCVMLLGIGNTGIGNVSIRGVAMAGVAVFIGGALGVSASAVMGAVMGFLLLSAGEGVERAVAVSSAAMLAGVFGEFSRFSAGIGYLVGNVIVALILFEDELLTASVYESLIGMAVLLLPAKVYEAVRSAKQSSHITREGRLARSLSYKLGRMATVFSGLAEAYDEACAVLSPATAEKMGCEAETAVCKECKRHKYCWQTRRKDTVEDLRGLILAAINGENLGQAVPARCIDSIGLVNFVRTRADRSMPRVIDPQYRIMAGYCRNMERIVRGMSATARQDVQYDSELERAIIHDLDEAGIHAREVMVVRSENNTRITVIKKPCNGERACERRLQKVLSRTVGANIRCVDSGCDAGSYCVSEYEEAVRFSVSTGVAGLSKEGKEISGDSFAFTHLPDGRYMLALSDGMGSGDMAREESDTAVGFIESFLASGMDEHTMLDVVNQLLILRGREDTYSTADICILELAKGISVFLKIGACAGFIKRNAEVGVVEAGALPIGIIEGVVPAVSTRIFKDGDMIILLSDGVLDAYDMDVDRFSKELAGITERNPQEFADLILKNSLSAVGNVPRDDMTVMVARVWEGRIG